MSDLGLSRLPDSSAYHSDHSASTSSYSESDPRRFARDITPVGSQASPLPATAAAKKANSLKSSQALQLQLVPNLTDSAKAATDWPEPCPCEANFFQEEHDDTHSSEGSLATDQSADMAPLLPDAVQETVDARPKFQLDLSQLSHKKSKDPERACRSLSSFERRTPVGMGSDSPCASPLGSPQTPYTTRCEFRFLSGDEIDRTSTPDGMDSPQRQQARLEMTTCYTFLKKSNSSSESSDRDSPDVVAHVVVDSSTPPEAERKKEGVLKKLSGKIRSGKGPK